MKYEQHDGKFTFRCWFTVKLERNTDSAKKRKSFTKILERRYRLLFSRNAAGSRVALIRQIRHPSNAEYLNITLLPISGISTQSTQFLKTIATQ